MESKSTRERILEEALYLFSQKGFPGTSVEEIAQGVGIKAPSLYKHFPSKQAIFDAALDSITPDPSPARRRLLGAQEEAKNAGSVSEALLWSLVRGLFEDALHDPAQRQLRRVLTLEQYRDPAAGARYTRLWVTEPMEGHRALFAALQEEGLLRKGDPQVMAGLFTAPVLQAVALCDREPDREEEVLAQLEQHAHLFYRVFAVRSNPGQPAQPQGGVGRLFRR